MALDVSSLETWLWDAACASRGRTDAMQVQLGSKLTCVTRHKLKGYKGEWTDTKAIQQDKLCFSASNRRLTGAPPRDFHLYLLQPLDPPYFSDEKEAGELFFRLTDMDEEL